MNLASAPGTLAIVNYCNLFTSAVMTIYSGTQPATSETALSGNTALALYTFSVAAFSGVPTVSGGFDYLAASFVSANASPAATGTATFARVVFATPAARANTTAYTRGALITASSNLWVCTASGTTSGTSTLTGTTYGTLDGTAVFDYVGLASTTTNLCDLTVGTTATDIILGTTSITVGTTVTISSFHLQVAVL